MKAKVITPDVVLQPHNASLEMAFYTGQQFPAEYRGDIFASEHGSWNKSVRARYELIRVPLHQTGHAGGEYEDFLTGFVLDNGNVWGGGAGRWALPSRKTARCWSPMTARTLSGGLATRGNNPVATPDEMRLAASRTKNPAL